MIKPALVGLLAASLIKTAAAADTTTTLSEITAAAARQTTAPAFNPAWLRGPYSAEIKVLTHSGQSAAGRHLELSWNLKKFGRHTVAETTIPASGIARLDNLPGATRESTWDDWEQRGGVPFLDVLSDSQDIGTVKFYELDGERVLPPADGATSKSFEFRMPPMAGDVAPEITLIDAETSRPVRLADLRGKIVLLDFWATWCPPCQPAMADLQKAVRANRDQWNDQVVILTVSIDDDLETLRKHLARRGWKDTRNAWTPPDPNDADRSGFYAPGAETYGINETPTMLLLDRDGRIIRRGRFDATKEINALLSDRAAANQQP